MFFESLKQFFPVVILLIAVWVVLSRIPKVDLGHSKAFQTRRLWNWLPLGLTYAFLYMARYNLTVSKNAFGDLMTNADFGTIFGVGTIVYGFAFVINGPLTDKMGGRKAKSYPFIAGSAPEESSPCVDSPINQIETLINDLLPNN